ncbi:hypothetical protein C8A00DRAFT_19695 [Chaetomidium leptoderma]|uniref:Uncharacterized protein n=1 Tax=Chaetomidium leptoderma TaxID=669021 RepID=A0AAN6VBY5_9PEZI|nr:hypothetical protein C8A00DRAFT_19695 [Chaetomidium leptoderma]
MLIAPTVAPVPTPAPAPTLASAYGLIQPRQTDYYGNCYNVEKAYQCTSVLSGCYGGDYLSATDYNVAATSCFCTYGISYLDCFYSQVATGTCASYYFGTEGTSRSRSYYIEYCGSIPPNAMANIQPPTSVSLDLETVDVVTATGAIRQPNYAGQPNYQGSGELLKGPCTATSFTQVDASSTVYYAGFVGCAKDRPECCPWAVATTGTPVSGGAGANDKDNSGYDFPTPVNNDLAQLASCADDYYSISGGCCPNGFWPFTSAVGGITPCWSSIARVAPPTLTLEKDAKTMDKPTSAVVNIVWSMRYPVADPGGGGLSTAAKAGIGAGAGVAAILIAGLAFCLWRSKRKNKKLAEPQQPIPPQPTFQQPQPQMMQQGAVPNGQYPPGPFPPGMVAPGMMAPPSDGASIMTSATPVSAAALVPQTTGTSGGGVSELSSQSGQNLLHNGQPSGYFPGGTAAAANPRAYPQDVPEMSSHREADPPQEVMGSQVQNHTTGQ